MQKSQNAGNKLRRLQTVMTANNLCTCSAIFSHPKISPVVQEYNVQIGGVHLNDKMTDEIQNRKMLKKSTVTLTDAYKCYKKNPNKTDKSLTHP